MMKRRKLKRCGAWASSMSGSRSGVESMARSKSRYGSKSECENSTLGMSSSWSKTSSWSESGSKSMSLSGFRYCSESGLNRWTNYDEAQQIKVIK
jgi:hypothetical protein